MQKASEVLHEQRLFLSYRFIVLRPLQLLKLVRAIVEPPRHLLVYSESRLP